MAFRGVRVEPSQRRNRGEQEQSRAPRERDTLFEEAIRRVSYEEEASHRVPEDPPAKPLPQDQSKPAPTEVHSFTPQVRQTREPEQRVYERLTPEEPPHQEDETTAVVKRMWDAMYATPRRSTRVWDLVVFHGDQKYTLSTKELDRYGLSRVISPTEFAVSVCKVLGIDPTGKGFYVPGPTYMTLEHLKRLHGRMIIGIGRA